MIYLLLAIASTSLVAIVMRISGKYLKSNLGMTFFNYVVCVFAAGIYSGYDNLMPRTSGFPFVLGIGVVTGVLYLAGLLLTQFNIQKNGVVLSTIFQKLGLVVQVLMSVILFGERPVLSQIIGIVICLIAVVLINFEKGQTAISFKLGLVLLVFVSGLCDGMSKVQEELGDPALSEHFLFYTFSAALILCAALIIRKREKMGWKDVLFGVMLGVPNFFSCRFLLKSLSAVPAVIAYPTYSVAAVVVVTMAGVIAFKEKLSKKQWLSLGMILVALVLLNI